MEPAATIEIPAEPYGIARFWSESDAVIQSVTLILLIMSILSWTQIVLKTRRAMKRKRVLQAVEGFWQAPTLGEAISMLERQQESASFAELARQGIRAAEHADAGKGIGSAVERGEFITRALRQGIVRAQARMESGLSLLASIGSVAPFVGLFGTVWGIYHALLGIASTGSASIDKISGPVGEALIMTAAGLFVAIPAVLAYNAFVRMNRLELAELDGFAHDLHAYLGTGSRVEPRPNIHIVGK